MLHVVSDFLSVSKSEGGILVISRSPEPPTLPNQAKVTASWERPSGQGRARIIDIGPRSYTPEDTTLQRKNFQKTLLATGRHIKTGSPKVVHPRRRLPRTRDQVDVDSALGVIDPRS